MPSKKIIATFLVCGALVGSIWIINRASNSNNTQNDRGAVQASNPRSTIEVSNDWKKLLHTDMGTTTIIGSVTAASPYSGEGTSIDLLAKDFFSQYLTAPKDASGNITDDQVNNIVANTLSNPAYTSVEGPQYTENNLYKIGDTSTSTILAYYAALRDAWNSNNNNPDINVVLQKSVESGNLDDLKQLDPYIVSGRKYIHDLLQTTVPKDAVVVHLDLLNSASNVENDIESIRNASSDSLKAFSAYTSYAKHVVEFANALGNIVMYFDSKK